MSFSQLFPVRISAFYLFPILCMTTVHNYSFDTKKQYKTMKVNENPAKKVPLCRLPLLGNVSMQSNATASLLRLLIPKER